ncbi:MAG TPA: cation:proton antiporter [Actinomycetota bacterium]|nr:cation:proton antiporter [Actinomycetota bacterium]
MEGVTILLVITVAYGLLAERLDRWSISAPMVFVAAGWALGPDGTGLLELSLDSEVVLTFTEITLAALLFADATTVPLRDVEGDARLPGRLLSIGLLLTIAIGTVVGLTLTPELGWAGAALIASVLAPTDAALGMAVVTDRAVPVRIRRALNIESGLNDGIATPFVTVFLAAVLSEEGLEKGSWILDAVVQIGLALLVAIVVGGLGAWLVSAASGRGWTSHLSEQLCVLGLAVLSYVGAVAIGGNGFVSAFTAGLVFGAMGKPPREAIGFTEDASLFASFLVWVVFGASFVGPVVAGSVDASAIVYALLSLTVVRMVPVAIALARMGFRPQTVAFMGWFGPRGLASVVFTLLAVEELRGAPVDLPLFEIATWTILLSVILHGVTARPLSAAFGRRLRAGDPGAPELVQVAESRPRRHLLRHRTDAGSATG